MSDSAALRSLDPGVRGWPGWTNRWGSWWFASLVSRIATRRLLRQRRSGSRRVALRPAREDVVGHAEGEEALERVVAGDARCHREVGGAGCWPEVLGTRRSGEPPPGSGQVRRLLGRLRSPSWAPWVCCRPSTSPGPGSATDTTVTRSARPVRFRESRPSGLVTRGHAQVPGPRPGRLSPMASSDQWSSHGYGA